MDLCYQAYPVEATYLQYRYLTKHVVLSSQNVIPIIARECYNWQLANPSTNPSWGTF